ENKQYRACMLRRLPPPPPAAHVSNGCPLVPAAMASAGSRAAAVPTETGNSRVGSSADSLPAASVCWSCRRREGRSLRKVLLADGWPGMGLAHEAVAACTKGNEAKEAYLQEETLATPAVNRAAGVGDKREGRLAPSHAPGHGDVLQPMATGVA